MRAVLLANELDDRKVATHGFRATARTLLDEVHDIWPDIIEHELGRVAMTVASRNA